MIGCEAWQSTLRPRVSSMQFSPSFLQDGNPELTISTRRKSARAVAFDREKIINDDWLLITIDEHLYHVDTCRIDFFSDEHSLYPLLKLC